MLTYPPETLVRDERPAYRPFAATVSSVEQVSPGFVRVTFTSPAFASFATHELDQRIKIVFPQGGMLSDIGATDPACIADGTWYARWRALPDDARCPFRTYTVAAARPDDREVDVLFADHGETGPAGRWLAAAASGDEVVIVGPDAASLHSHIGIDWHPGDATDVLLVGDETAAPAIRNILSSLPLAVRARAFIEVPSARDRLEVRVHDNVDVTWIARDGAANGERLDRAVRAWVAGHPESLRPALARRAQDLDDVDVDRELLWDSPGDEHRRFYAWLAGEAGVIKSLRRLLVADCGVDRHHVAFMGYWRLGRSEAQ